MDEELGWNFSFQGWKNRWQDTVHSMYRLIEHQKQSIANRAVQLRKEGKAEMKLEFANPMTRFKDVFSQLLAPKTLADPSSDDNRWSMSARDRSSTCRRLAQVSVR